MTEVIRTLTLEKETPGTYRFEEAEENGQVVVFGKIYVKKAAFDGAAPDNITLTLEF